MDDENPEDYPLILWPTAAIEGALEERDRLDSIIDRAAEALDAGDPTRARAILAEADPIDLEAPEG